MTEKCRGWQARILSQGGKAVLIKTVLQALPTHIFYALSPPKAVVKQIERLFADFFWGEIDGKKKYHWGSWKTLAKPTGDGGVGFLGMQDLVDAAGMKLWWNFRKGGTIWSEFLMNKYCKEIHPVVRGWQYKDSHVWRRMIQAREKAEPQLIWKIGEGMVNLWWDNWSGRGAMAGVLNIRGKRRAKDILKDFLVGNRVDLQRLGIDQAQGWDGTLVCSSEGVQDKICWGAIGEDFTFKAAKKLVQGQANQGQESLWCKKIWAKGIPWKMSFLAWRVFKKKLPMDDTLRRMGFHTVSMCPCCVQHGCDSLNHVFGMGETAKQVWDYFAKSLGLLINVRSERHVCYEWWLYKVDNRMLKFMVQRLPVLILWELWVNYSHCKYGNGRTSVARIIYKVGKDMAECIQRKWPHWDPLPPCWKFIMKKVDSFGCGRITQRSNWCRPWPGVVKVNWALDNEEKSCAFFVRNSRGRFCLAGVYSLENGQNLEELIQSMLGYCWEWCKFKRITKVIFETSNWRGIELNGLDTAQGSWIRKETCLERVNCVASCLANRCCDLNIIFNKVEGLPRGLDHLLALEGVPHFVFLPGIDNIK
ncbi:PREDICTED: uncharacterized protein LOC109147873 [Ipomoea nil]|uniref:uncharacterized protein LOC109147873 n=1 Tax=Ipomoea nil TaxID=35883 RepID=UPI000901273E|nr:PREDICTED: uncharacterized protein LOC109147873 [Ipomoea nil]